MSNAVSSVSWSNVPNPSSINIDSSEIPPDCCCTISLNPKANASDDWKVSPPDKELICLDLFECKSDTSISRPLRPWETASLLISWYRLSDIVANLRFAWAIIWSK